ncbi:MAG: MoxR family ATPase [Thermodesulfobacteriota bacterium]
MAGNVEIDVGEGKRLYEELSRILNRIIRGQSGAVRKLLAGFVSGGHVLLEDYPGTGKTTLAKALAGSVDLGFKRIQFTPDLLPSDILGVSILDPGDNRFHFHAGPIFGDIVLADEINRASPRTQSALLEAMAEGQVSIDGTIHPLDKLFFVIATQNPVDSHGTYPLPEAQMDRFALKFSLGYVEPEDEVAILEDQSSGHPLDSLEPCIDRDELLGLKTLVSKVKISEEMQRYCVDIAAATRSAAGVKLGASPRGSLALMTVSRTLALFDGLDYVIPDHIREIAVDVLSHRVGLDHQALFGGTSGSDIVSEIIESLPVPA